MSQSNPAESVTECQIKITPSDFQKLPEGQRDSQTPVEAITLTVRALLLDWQGTLLNGSGAEGPELFSDATAFLAGLPAGLSKTVVSNMREESLAASMGQVFNRNELNTWQSLAAGQTIGDRALSPKPSPDMLNAALAIANEAVLKTAQGPRALMIGDSLTDLQAAWAANLPCVIVCRSGVLSEEIRNFLAPTQPVNVNRAAQNASGALDVSRLPQPPRRGQVWLVESLQQIQIFKPSSLL